MDRSALILVPLLVIACAPSVDADDPASAEGAIYAPAGAGSTVSGYDLTAPVSLPARAADELCAAMLSEEATACEAVGGTVARATECRDLCSLPIAKPGFVAGYDASGFAILPAREATRQCSDLASPVTRRCRGDVARATECRVLCSLPL